MVLSWPEHRQMELSYNGCSTETHLSLYQSLNTKTLITFISTPKLEFRHDNECLYTNARWSKGGKCLVTIAGNPCCFWGDAWCNDLSVCLPSLPPILGLASSGFSMWYFLKLVARGFLRALRFPPFLHRLMVQPMK